MTETTNINRVKMNLVTFFLAILASTVAVYAASAAIAAKPADAATCASYAYHPHRDPDYADNWLFAPGWVECTGTNSYMKEIYVKVQLQRQNANGGWSVLKTQSAYKTNSRKAWADAKIDCGTTYTWATYRTVTTGYTVAPNNYTRYYGPTYSRKVSAYC